MGDAHDEIQRSADPAGRIPADAASRLAADGALVLVDIRTPAEWAQTGVAAGAALAPLTEGPQRLRADFARDLERILNGDRSRPVALVCRTGGRSAFARELLRREGFTQVLDVAEGMAGSEFGPGWIARGLPVERWTPGQGHRGVSTSATD